LAAIDKVGKDLVKARRERDERRFGELAVQIHLMLFACTGFPRLLELIRVVIGPVGLRYDRALVYPYPEAWDALLELSLARVDAVRARDATRVREVVTSYRERLHELALSRIADPAVARYFREP
jgi:DNA-binding GntR family transcriptional regulator